MRELERSEDLEVIWPAARTLIFKHSSACPVSFSAHREIEKVEAEFPELQVVIVDVIRQRKVSQQIANKTGVKHESPQAILYQDGKVRWHGSHFEVTRERLAKVLQGE